MGVFDLRDRLRRRTSLRKPLLFSAAVLGVGVPLTLMMFQTCSVVRPQRALLIWAMVVDDASTQAANKLAAKIDSFTYDEDAADLRLLERVKTLDVADDVLPRQVAQLQAERSQAADSDRLRAEVLERLDAVTRDYNAVIEASQNRLLHRAVLQELARVPAALANLRADVDARKSD